MDTFFRNRGFAVPPPHAGGYTTPLNDLQLGMFLRWPQRERVPYDPWAYQPVQDYDMPGEYLRMLRGGVQRNPFGGRFTDLGKTPYHESFSGESLYALPGPITPRWQGDALIGPDGSVFFKEGQ